MTSTMQTTRRSSILGDVSEAELKIIRSLPRPHCRRVKVISLGCEGVGKSCIIKRYCEEHFVTRYITTIGIDYGVKLVTVKDQPVKINFWDLSGNPEYFEIRNEFYSDAEGVLMVFDVNNRKTFTDLEAWRKEAEQFGAPAGIPVVVCANKTDLCRNPSNPLESEAEAWAEKHGFTFWRTSANSGLNIVPMFEKLFLDAVEFSQAI
eukprot:TRINITY_DN2401_c0_g1_i1.p2 TRINITY_DN2401_c0_g1~~TRINITY_DN2401_c0_g1_i1.p2  ORF type:complete len:206 (+),score=35.87 TRINITY_DN2401_c0_g1_i1:1352-1969(+)